MQQRVRKVAARIRELREIAGVAPDDLARELGIPGETYRSYEEGRADIPLGALYEVAAHFGIELGTLLTGDEPHLHRYAVVRAGDGPLVERRRPYRYHSLAPNFAHKKAEPFLVTIEPSAPAPDPGAHPGQEFLYLLAGTLAVTIGAAEVALGPGDALYFDSGAPHALRATGPEPARVLAVIL
jgi:quercetin dioxygenase-like cupin family protein